MGERTVDRFRGNGETMVLRASDSGDTWRMRFDTTGMCVGIAGESWAMQW